MKFAVKFTSPLLRSGRPLHLYGSGSIHFLEIGLVAEGWRPKFRVHGVDLFLRLITGEQSIITIPYALIREYRSPSLLRRQHLIRLSLTAENQRLTFKVPGNDRAFALRLEEYINLAKAWKQGK